MARFWIARVTENMVGNSYMIVEKKEDVVNITNIYITAEIAEKAKNALFEDQSR